MDEILMDYFTARGIPGWHRIGTVFPADEHITLLQAGERTGMNFHTEMGKVYVEIQGKLIEMPNHAAVCRPPLKSETEWLPMEIVGKNYQQVPNDNLFEMFNGLSELFPVETLGLLGRGERIFICLDAGFVSIKGDTVHNYFTIYDEKSGRSSTKVFVTPVRTECANTVRMGLEQATLTLNVTHVRGNLFRLEKIAQIALDLKQRLDFTNQLFLNMATATFPIEDFKTAVSQIYKLPPNPEEIKVIDVTVDYEKLRIDRLAHQTAALNLFEKFNDEHPGLALTQWGAFQSVVELEDWKKGRGNGRYASALFGERAEIKMDAFAIISGLPRK